jgi:HPt (histidine-containing phosphotransfer) domain-containing protein
VPTLNPEPIDPQAWSELRALGGEDADSMVDELIDMYLEESIVLLEAIQRDHQSSQPQCLARSSHALRSPSATLGALRLAEHCRQVEEASTRGALPPDAVIQELMEEAQRVIIDLQSRRRTA